MDTQPRTPFNHEQILLVDDSIALLRKLAFLLEIAGFSVLTAFSTENALDILRLQTPDLIISDVEMPATSGYDLLQTIRTSRQWRHIPVILTSDKYGLDDLMHALDLGAADFLPKPFDIYDVLDSVKRTLDEQPSGNRRLAG
jgi:DNA-binding response OmpR family regulator